MAADGMMERRIYRRLNDDFITRLGEGQHCHIETTNNTWHERHPILMHIPMMMPKNPFPNGLKISLIFEMITVDRMLSPLDDSFAHEVGGLKVHVGHPHGQHIRIAEDLLAQVIFNAVGISAINGFVEIVFHCLIVVFDFETSRLQEERSQGATRNPVVL